MGTPIHWLRFKKNIFMNMAFTYFKHLFNENEPCYALRDDYLKIATLYDAERKAET